MNVIDKNNLKIISADIEKALESVAKKHGVSLTRGRGKYSNASTGSLVIEIATIGVDGTVESRERSDFKRLHDLYGLSLDALDAEFTANGSTYRIIGLDLGRRKRPILCEANGHQYLFPSEQVKHLLNR